jgi:hypothetical protein
MGQPLGSYVPRPDLTNALPMTKVLWDQYYVLWGKEKIPIPLYLIPNP